jgi:hypothetical protein
MKLNKKLVCLSAAAVMALSSVSAFADNGPTNGLTNVDGAPVSGSITVGFNDWTAPVPAFTGNNRVAYNQAVQLLKTGFYYEAYVALAPVKDQADAGLLSFDDAAIVYDVMNTIENAIDRVIIEEAFDDVEAFIADGYYAEASDVLINDVYALGQGKATSSALTGATTGASEILYSADSFTLDDWNRARSLEAQIGAVIGDIVNSKDAAIRRVQFMYGDDLPADAWFYVAKVGNRYDVYVNMNVPSGAVVEIGEVDIASNGTILVDTMPYTPASPWNNPID